MRCLALTCAAAAFAASLFGFAAPAAAQPDIRLCQLYGTTMVFGTQPARVGDTVGMAVATTSWNIGDEPADWFQSPSGAHPFIAQNLYRLQDGRMQLIGQSWVKHGFFALANAQCGGTCQVPPGYFGQYLGVNCTDTYSSSLNGSQSSLGPRYEINPWTGVWHSNSSILQTGLPGGDTAITRRMQVKDADLVAFDSTVQGGNPTGVRYFVEAYYVAADDRDVMNSAAWREIRRITGSPGATWTLQTSIPPEPDSTQPVNVGFALDAWPDLRQTIVAIDPNIVENVMAPVLGEPASPDGRAIIASKVTDNGNGTWRYEYAVLNIDMDRQIGSFSVPVPSGVMITNAGAFAARHHNEPYAWSEFVGGVRVYGKAINNDPWNLVISGDSVTWSTPGVGDTEPSNPIRWGTMHNFWFDADAPPEDGLASVGLFKTGTPDSLDGLTDVPSAGQAFCAGNANGDDTVDFNDITSILANWLNDYIPGTGPGDANGDGVVDFNDITAVLANWLNACP